MALDLYPGESAILQPGTILDGKGAAVKPPIAGATYVSEDDAIVLVETLNDYTARITAVGTAGQDADITQTVVGASGDITTVLDVNIVSRLPVSAEIASGVELAAVKERPLVGPPG